MGWPTVPSMIDAYQYSYRSASSLTADRLDLQTTALPAGVVDERTGPFFVGFARHPAVLAAGVLAVSAVARARYFQPAPSAVRDPVISSDGHVVRLESFSDCCGVHARLDLLPESLDGSVAGRGTTNVDVNEPLRRALARVGDDGLLHLAVGSDELAVTTGEGAVIERRVPLPPRWLRGFAEVQVITSGFEPKVDLGRGATAAFLGALPSTSRASGATWWMPSAGGLRPTSRPGPGAICLAGPQRLDTLRTVLRHATGLRVHGPAVNAGSPPVASSWQVDLPGARLTVTVSPEVRRGFSGEGSVLGALAEPGAEDAAETVLALLEDSPDVEAADLAERCELRADQIRAALVWLGASGQVGYDVAQARYFPRQLPYRADAAERANPRLRNARALVAAGQVRFSDATDGDGDGDGDDRLATVTVGDWVHRVRRHQGQLSCTCPWYAAYGTSRGPCKHALAVRLITDRGARERQGQA